MRAMYCATYASASPPRCLLKSSSCAKSMRLEISSRRAGGYWPTQYQDPGASQMRFAGSRVHCFEVLDTLRTLKMRTLLKRDV